MDDSYARITFTTELTDSLASFPTCAAKSCKSPGYCGGLFCMRHWAMLPKSWHIYDEYTYAHDDTMKYNEYRLTVAKTDELERQARIAAAIEYIKVKEQDISHERMEKSG